MVLFALICCHFVKTSDPSKKHIQKFSYGGQKLLLNSLQIFNQSHRLLEFLFVKLYGHIRLLTLLCPLDSFLKNKALIITN